MTDLFSVGTCSGCIQTDCPMSKQWKLNPSLGCDRWTDGVDIEQDPLMTFEIEAGFYQENGVTKLRAES